VHTQYAAYAREFYDLSPWCIHIEDSKRPTANTRPTYVRSGYNNERVYSYYMRTHYILCVCVTYTLTRMRIHKPDASQPRNYETLEYYIRCDGVRIPIGINIYVRKKNVYNMTHALVSSHSSDAYPAVWTSLGHSYSSDVWVGTMGTYTRYIPRGLVQQYYYLRGLVQQYYYLWGLVQQHYYLRVTLLNIVRVTSYDPAGCSRVQSAALQMQPRCILVPFLTRDVICMSNARLSRVPMCIPSWCTRNVNLSVYVRTTVFRYKSHSL